MRKLSLFSRILIPCMREFLMQIFMLRILLPTSAQMVLLWDRQRRLELTIYGHTRVYIIIQMLRDQQMELITQLVFMLSFGIMEKLKKYHMILFFQFHQADI